MDSDSQQTFGRYVLLRRLAFGGMAEIFLAALRGDEGFEKKVVVKRILPQFSSDPNFVQMFIDEARLSARITHPNVTQVHDFGSVDGLYFIAMEYVDGVDLRRVVKDSGGAPLSAAHTAALGEHVARGLAHAHNLTDDSGNPLHIVHRDVSPHNIMISRSGEAKLMDFGIARAEARASRTATGTIKGKVAYMAPEQAADREVDKRCDQFALGLVLWECLTGRRLFQGDSDLEVLRRVVACDVQPVRAWRPEVPPELETIVMRTLAQAPNGRYPDAAELADALAEFRYGLGSAGAARLSDLIEGAGRAGARRTWSLAARPTREAPTAQLHEGRGAMPAGSARLEPVPESPLPSSPLSSRPLVWALAGVAVAALAMTGILALRGSDPPRTVPQATLTVTSEPPGAAIALYGRDTGLKTPAVLPVGRAGDELLLRLALDGHETWEQSMNVQSTAMQVAAVLARRASPPAAPAASAPTPAPPPEPPSKAPPLPDEAIKARPPARAKAAPRHSGAKAEPAGVAKRGHLSLRSSGPWLEVYLNGRKLGVTPLARADVPAGRLILRLVNAAAQVDRTIEVDVPANGEVRKTVEF